MPPGPLSKSCVGATMPEMESGDYVLTPSGHLYSMVSLSEVEGRFIGEYNTAEEALEKAKQRMDEEKWWPRIWWVSDHGNYWEIDEEGNEVRNEEEEED